MLNFKLKKMVTSLYVGSKLKSSLSSLVRWHMPLTPALGRQKQEDLWIWGQPSLLSKLYDCWGSIVDPLFFVLGIEVRASHIQDRHSTTKIHPRILWWTFYQLPVSQNLWCPFTRGFILLLFTGVIESRKPCNCLRGLLFFLCRQLYKVKVSWARIPMSILFEEPWIPKLLAGSVHGATSMA